MFKVWLTAMLLAVYCFTGVDARAQSTEFSYQGIIKDGANPANGNYDLEFRLFDAAVDGSQIGSTNSRLNVAIAGGLVSTILNFGSGFPGANRFLEIRVRNAGSGGFTILDPRQKVVSAPYSIKSLSTENAAQLGGVDANNYLQTTGNGSGLTNLNAGSITTGTLAAARGGTGVTTSGADGNYLRSNGAAWASSAIQAVDIPTGSGNYIQNTGTPQVASAFNISGTGTANIFNAATQFNIGVDRVLSAPGTTSTFAGRFSGVSHTSGVNNSFFGASSGTNATTGGNNSFFGSSTGLFINTGSDNTFIGFQAGFNNSTSSNNTMIGSGANVVFNGLTFATAVGSNAVVDQSNRIHLGRNGLDTVRVGSLTSASAAPVCILNLTFASCSSSQRYKRNIANFSTGIELVNKLRPVVFDWIGRDEHDLGLIAEEVAAAEPLLATYNDKGEIEGVKYKQLSIVLINAVKEQQKQIDELESTNSAQNEKIRRLEMTRFVQQKQLDNQQVKIDALLRLACSQTNEPSVCR